MPNTNRRMVKATHVLWPQKLWERVTAAATEQELNFGAFVRLAAKEKLDRSERNGAA